MEQISLHLAIALIAGLYMAWNIGANDVANAMGTSVGSGAVTFRKAILIAAVFEFLGAMLVGSHVAETMRSGIVHQDIINNADVYVAGMLSALIGAAIWLNVATYLGLPVSTTHSIVGAIFGFGLIYGGVSSVNWGQMASIVASWVVSPLAGAIIGFGAFWLIQKKVLNSKQPARAAAKTTPILIFPVVVILVLSIIYKGLKNLHLDLSFPMALLLAAGSGLLAALLFAIGLRNFWDKCKDLCQEDQLDRVERLFGYLQVCTACYVAFAHGANDVANAVGPIAGIYCAVRDKVVADSAEVPVWILAIGAVGIVTGLATYGYKVISTIGHKITEMTPTRGFSAEFACATTVLVCSRMGLPISTTHTLVGSVIGVGFARGIAGLDQKVILNIVYSWVTTIPASALIAIVCYQIIDKFL